MDLANDTHLDAAASPRLPSFALPWAQRISAAVYSRKQDLTLAPCGWRDTWGVSARPRRVQSTFESPMGAVLRVRLACPTPAPPVLVTPITKRGFCFISRVSRSGTRVALLHLIERSGKDVQL